MEAIKGVGTSRYCEAPPTIDSELEGHLRVGEGVLEDEIDDSSVFGLWSSLECQTCRLILEQPLHRDPRSTRPRRRRWGADPTLLH